MLPLSAKARYILIMYAWDLTKKNCPGKLATWGKPSKDFSCYLQLKGSTKSLMEARDKILVNFDPTQYFLQDLQVLKLYNIF
jgi:hypothetical protein